MKKLIAVLIAAFILNVLPARADLFPSLKPDVQQDNTPLAPSYGGMANVDPDETTTDDEGRQKVIYRNVDMNGYTAFGDYLEAQSFEVLESDVDQQSGVVRLSLGNGSFNIDMVYDSGKQEMCLIYERGVSYEIADPFKGYTRIGLNEKVSIQGLGDFRFDSFALNEAITYCNNFFLYELNGKWQEEYHTKEKANTWLVFDFYNTSTTDKEYYRDHNDLLDMELVYINLDNTYSYREKAYGTYWENIISVPVISIAQPWHIVKDWMYFSPKTAKPLEYVNNGVVFDLPEGIRYSTDGTLAIKMIFNSGDQYVLILRENGVKLY